MNEETICTGKASKPVKLLVIAICLIAIIFLMRLFNIGYCRIYVYDTLTFSRTTEYSIVDNMLIGDNKLGGFVVGGLAWVSLLMIVTGLIYYLAYRKVSIIVTNKRVYGTAAWGKFVELPLDKISAVATSFGHGIAVSTSSGSIRFKAIANNAEVHAAISKLLMERQDFEPISSGVASQSNAEELKKYKDLLDSGIITQEEFDAKKKQLLGL